MGDTGCDSAFAQADSAHKGHGGRGVGVAVDDGDFEQVAGGIGEGLAVFDAGLGFAGAGDDLAVEGFDHAHDGAGGGDGEIGGDSFAAVEFVDRGREVSGRRDVPSRATGVPSMKVSRGQFEGSATNGAKLRPIWDDFAA